MLESKKEKETTFSSQKSNVSTQASPSKTIHVPTQTAIDENDDDDEEKVEFFLKVRKHKKLKYY